jgi:signal transduction histidine kinase
MTRTDKAKATRKKPRPKRLPFTVASALLKELGERLVGKPHIALAELVKNSYDADARTVVISFHPGRIEVSDNGHGMSFNEFKNFWMRIGSPHKQSQRVSREFKRPMTGSKGVGRLAVQFLANKIELRTVSNHALKHELKATVNWDEASRAGELTRAEALYLRMPAETLFPDESSHGTKIVLNGLNQVWTAEDFKNLGSEIWWLQPPFQPNPELSSERQKAFEVVFESPEEDAVAKFDLQMRAVQDLWHARLVGKLVNQKKTARGPEVHLSLEFSNGDKTSWEYSVKDLLSLTDSEGKALARKDWGIHNTTFEIRVFHLRYKQKFGIKVKQAQDYLNAHGGVHVYDAGFHLPYYGPDTDWLGTEKDHSHRLTKSQLLPEYIQEQVVRGMNFLPTMSRLLGVVHVDTASEREKVRGSGNKLSEALTIQVSRDRLVDNNAFRGLRDIVRTALDFYAFEEAKRAFKESEQTRKTEPLRHKFERVDQVLTHYKREIPEPVFEELRDEVRVAIDASDAETKEMAEQVGLLGSLATAGMSALAYEHEVVKQLQLLDEVTEELNTIHVPDNETRQHLKKIATNLSEWIERAHATRALFSSLMEEENRVVRTRLKARPVVEQVSSQMAILLRSVKVDSSGIDDTLRFPKGSFAELSAIFQNVLINAANAMLDSKTKLIAVKSRTHGRSRSLLVQDTGTGVDLKSAEDLFRPFIRKSKISRERQQLGLGGAGLGLAIVKMIANNIHCKVAFVAPDANFRTAFQLSWNEAQ